MQADNLYSGAAADDLKADQLRRTRRRRREAMLAWGLATPSILLLLAVMVLPIISVAVMSFTDYRLGGRSLAWVGLDNYRTMLGDAVFWRSFSNTLTYASIVVPGAVLIGLLQAVLVSNLRYGRRLYQVLFFLPVTSTLVAMATVWKYLMHGTIGPINIGLRWLGLDTIEFFGDPDTVLFALSVIGIWALAGFNMVLFTAGLTAIPQDLYDAASVDGFDHPLDHFFRITLPMLAPTTVFIVITSTITAFKIFDTVAVLTRGGPGGGSDVLLYTTYLEGFEYLRMGSAAAMTITFLAVLLLLALLQNRLLDRNKEH